MNFTNLERTSSVTFTPNGVYKGIVVAVDESNNTVSIVLPRINGKFVRDKCKVLCPTMPVVGENVGCVFAENETSEVYVIGVIKNTTSYDAAPILVYPAANAPSPSATAEGQFYYDTTNSKFLIHSGAEYLPPWNMPWGILASDRITSTVTSTSRTVLVDSGLTVNFVPVVNRKYKFTFTGHTLTQINSTTAATQTASCLYHFTNGASANATADNFSPDAIFGSQVSNEAQTSRSANNFTAIFYENFTTNTSIQRTIFLTVGYPDSTVHQGLLLADTTRPATFIVEDIGPVPGTLPAEGNFTLGSNILGILGKNLI